MSNFIMSILVQVHRQGQMPHGWLLVHVHRQGPMPQGWLLSSLSSLYSHCNKSKIQALSEFLETQCSILDYQDISESFNSLLISISFQ